jgi:acyl transferase domain-containing protein
MMSVNLSEDSLRGYFRDMECPEIEQGIHIACFNSRSNITISGDEDLIDAFKVRLDVDGIFAAKLNTRAAYHSPAMSLIASEYEAVLGALETQAGASPIAMISSVDGQLVQPRALLNPRYWADNLVNPVRFVHAMERLLAPSAGKRMGIGRRIPFITDLLEVGSHPALRRPIQTILASMGRQNDTHYSATLSRFKSSLDATLELAGALFTYGYPIDLSAVNEGFTGGSLLTDTPEYPFDHSQKYWCEPRLSRGLRLRHHPRSDLLGIPVMDWNPLEPRWRKVLTMDEHPWIGDHVVRQLRLELGLPLIIPTG